MELYRIDYTVTRKGTSTSPIGKFSKVLRVEANNFGQAEVRAIPLITQYIGNMISTSPVLGSMTAGDFSFKIHKITWLGMLKSATVKDIHTKFTAKPARNGMSVKEAKKLLNRSY